MGDPRTKKLIVLGILTLSKKILQVSLYYVKVSLCKISKTNEFWLARYLNIYKSGRSKNKKNNSSWNTHSIKKRPCAFPRIMINYFCAQFQSLAFPRIMINYFCAKFQSLTSLRCRDILYTNKRTNGQTDECEFIGHRFVKPVTNKLS